MEDKNMFQVKALRKQKRDLNKKLKYHEDKRHHYYKKTNELDDLIREIDKKISHLTHKYYKGDLVVVETHCSDGDKIYSMAQIQRTIGAKRYKIFEYFANGRVGTEWVILEDRIICKAESILGYFEIKRREKK